MAQWFYSADDPNILSKFTRIYGSGNLTRVKNPYGQWVLVIDAPNTFFALNEIPQVADAEIFCSYELGSSLPYSNYGGPGLRLTASGDGYTDEAHYNGAAIHKTISGSTSRLSQQRSLDLTIRSFKRFSVVGSTITNYEFTEEAPQSATPNASFTNTDITAAGYAGISSGDQSGTDYVKTVNIGVGTLGDPAPIGYTEITGYPAVTVSPNDVTTAYEEPNISAPVSLTIPTPADAVIGDTLVCLLNASGSNSSSITASAPAGWEISYREIGVDAGYQLEPNVFILTLTSTPAASYTFSIGGTAPTIFDIVGVLVRVQNASLTLPQAGNSIHDSSRPIDGIAIIPEVSTYSQNVLLFRGIFLDTGRLLSSPLTLPAGVTEVVNYSTNRGVRSGKSVLLLCEQVPMASTFNDSFLVEVSELTENYATSFAFSLRGSVTSTLATPINPAVTNLQATSARLNWEQG